MRPTHTDRGGQAFVRPGAPRAAAPGGRAAFTLIELLTVMAIIGLLAGLIVGLAPTASRAMKLKRVRGELQQIVMAIEAFKQKYGYYPPDNRDPVTQRNANPLVHQLFYELAGMRYDPAGKAYYSLDGRHVISPSTAEAIFRTKGFVNAAEDPAKVTTFLLGYKTNQVGELTVGPQRVLMLSAPVRGPGDPLKPNVWRYVSSSPTNNPSSFDLWTEVVIGRETNRISNWE